MSAAATLPAGTAPRAAPRLWWPAFLICLALTGLLAISIGWLLIEGVGVWGNNIPVTWALDIVGYDWWMGTGCGALLLACAARLGGAAWGGAAWDAPLPRLAATVALLAGLVAGVYPIVHLGRPWFFYWNLPYPTSLLLWPQFRSPLVWDAFDILGFLAVAGALWFVGSLPVLAARRDAAFALWRAGGNATWAAFLYGIAALGWRGAQRHWHRWRRGIAALAVLGIAQALTVQAGASLMFAITIEPGWHDPILPFATLAGALLSGTAIVALLLAIWCADPQPRAVAAWVLLGASLLVAACHAGEILRTLSGGTLYDRQSLFRAWHGAGAWCDDGLAASLILLQLLWLGPVRRSPVWLGVVGIAGAAGIWCDHFSIVVLPLSQDFLPSAAHPYGTTWWGAALALGTLGLAGTLLLLLQRAIPLTIADRPMPRPRATAGSGPVWAVAARFDTPAGLLDSLRQLAPRDARMEAYAARPLPMSEQVSGPIPAIAAAAAAAGFAASLAMAIYATTVSYRLLIGGRPMLDWPSYLIPSLSAGWFCGALATVLTVLAYSRLPRLNHPAFNIPGLSSANAAGLYLAIEKRGEHFDPEAVLAALAALPTPPAATALVPR